MTILICSCQGRKTIIKKFLSNYNHIQDIQTLHFVFELTSYMLSRIYACMSQSCVNYVELELGQPGQGKVIGPL
jgi:hypothetical protein